MERRDYPAEFRRRVLDMLAAGKRVSDIARDLEISDQTIYIWRRQERIDQGLDPGLTSAERAEPAAARRRIRELEAELEIHCRASDLLAERSDPKGASRRSLVMAADGARYGRRKPRPSRRRLRVSSPYGTISTRSKSCAHAATMDAAASSPR